MLIEDFHVTVRIRNNQLRRRREELGLTQADLCRKIPMQQGLYSAYECLREDPRSTHKGRMWKPSARRLADFHGLSPEDLWPDAVLDVAEPVARRAMSRDDVLRIVGTDAPRQIEAVQEEAVAQREEWEELARHLAELTEREQRIVSMRHGLGDHDEHTFVEIGQHEDRSKDRMMQVYNRALRRLRYLYAKARRSEGEPSRQERAPLPAHLSGNEAEAREHGGQCGVCKRWVGFSTGTRWVPGRWVQPLGRQGPRTWEPGHTEDNRDRLRVHMPPEGSETRTERGALEGQCLGSLRPPAKWGSKTRRESAG